MKVESTRVEAIEVDVEAVEGSEVDDEQLLEHRIAVILRQTIANLLSDTAMLPHVKSISVHYTLKDG